MPWKTDENGEKSYELSLYCKEELPTWEELYKEFWLGKVFNYDPDDPTHQEEDLYWKRPHRKLLLAWCCNQLNKLLHEAPGRRLLKKLWKAGVGGFFYFGLVNVEEKPPHFIDQKHVSQLTALLKNHIAPIYTCKLPSTDERSIFITNDHPRIDIDELQGKIELVIVLHSNHPNSRGTGTQDFEHCAEELLEEVINYFENGVGWKDEDGNVIPSERVTHCQGAGYDPAL